MSSILNQPLTKFQADVRAGLLTQPKTLPSKYFYDERGDELFARIMRLPEYYLTGCETEILHAYAESILSETGYGQEQFEILELGAGNGLKTRILLEAATGRGLNFTYLPVDISADSLEQARANILATVPACAVTAYVLDYTETALLPETDCPRLWLFLGSNLGNYDFSEAVDFLGRLTRRTGSRDTLLLGLDLHKDREIILPAYNDSAGVTAEFNLNLLRRMNYECETNFDLTHFGHVPLYNSRLRRAESYLQSLLQQRVVSELLELDIVFGESEGIQTEISQKYTLESVDWLLTQAGLRRRNTYHDARRYYVNVLCTKS